MYSHLIKDTIQIDKKAREAVQELKSKKENLDVLIKEEEKQLKKAMQKEIKDAVAALKKKYQEEIDVKKEQEKIKFDAALKELHDVYEREKDQWIETIYKTCIK